MNVGLFVETRFFASENYPYLNSTDIIKKGKSHCSTEFEHKFLVASGKSGVIKQCQFFRGNPSDGDMVPGFLKTIEN